MIVWITLEETLTRLNGGEKYTVCYCLANNGAGIKRMNGDVKTEVLNVPHDCIFTSFDKAAAAINDYAGELSSAGILDVFKIQLHKYSD